ncbi:MAG TPA: pyrroline-5-carboxylate reductase [Coriobacteriia bacterium]|nr:pyrroline-5-carboxylate reductase [Coriobacteriia bacterium]
MSLGHLSINGVLAIIGGGRMGAAIIDGLVSSGALGAGSIVVAEPNADRRAELVSAYGVRGVERATEAVDGAGMVLLAVKPQVIDDVVGSISRTVGDALVISIAAGVSCARLESQLPAGAAVVRVMPNAPARVGDGMSVISGGTHATDVHLDLARHIFSWLGKTLVLDERDQDVATAISGCGPAYVALVVDALARAGVRHGLTRAVAEELAVRTVAGTATLISRTGQHPERIIDEVSSPGGVTAAALEALEAGGVRAAFAEAVSAAITRAKELSS